MALTDNVFRVQCFGQLSGAERWANVWHVILGGTTAGVPAAAATFDTIAGGFDDFYGAIESIMSNQWTQDQCIVTQIDTPGASPRYYADGNVGSGGGDLLPTQDAIVISLRTSLAGKSGRGRIYLGGFDESAKEAASARLTATARDLIGDTTVALHDALDVGFPGGSGIAVYSRLLDVATLCTSFRVGTVFDTQRRRRNKLAELYTSYA